ncbi:MAG TPA: hypothetical protein VM661_09975 [Candidatus Sulfotelmatobacter sp.]|nr:hypothetical protein [Candidatus Sulfotelmatobacter sp.]
MAIVFALLVLLALIAIPVGLVRPKLVLFRSANPKRGQAAAVATCIFVVLLSVWISLLPPPPAKPVGQPVAEAPQGTGKSEVQAQMSSPPGETVDPRVISADSEAIVLALKNEAPRLGKTGEDRRGDLLVEHYLSQPSKVKLTLETLPGQGMIPGTAALVRATMERPLADRPSTYDGGLVKALTAFVSFSAPDWPIDDQQSFVAGCIRSLEIEGCDRTVKGVRVKAQAVDALRFVIEAGRL